MFDKTNRKLISDLAVERGFEPAAVLAVVKVEGEAVDMTDGIQDGKVDGLVMIRWEGHYFWRHLPEAKRAAARKAGLADPKVGGVKNPRSMKARHDMLKRAMAIDSAAALKSISMGVGQVMGANHAMCGYRTVFEMWHDAQTLLGQVRMMLGFIKAAGLDDELREARFTAFARGYNGPGFAANRYDQKMEQAYRMFGGTRPTRDGDDAPLRMGDARSDQVRLVQQRLKDLGYQVKVDGDFGPATRRAILAFQAENRLKTDGVVGPKTLAALYNAPVASVLPSARETASTAEVVKDSRIAKKGVQVEAVAGGTGLVVAAAEVVPTDWVEQAVKQSGAVRQVYDQVLPILSGLGDFKWLALALVLLFVAYQARRIVEARVEDHRSGRTV